MRDSDCDPDEVAAFDAAMSSLEELNQLLIESSGATATDVSKEDFERLFNRMDPFAWSGGVHDSRFAQHLAPVVSKVAVTLSQSLEAIQQFEIWSHQYDWIIDAAYPHLDDINKAAIVSFLLSLINDPRMAELEGYGIVHAAVLDSVRRESTLFADLRRAADKSDRFYEKVADVKLEQERQIQECNAIIQHCDDALNERGEPTGRDETTKLPRSRKS